MDGSGSSGLLDGCLCQIQCTLCREKPLPATNCQCQCSPPLGWQNPPISRKTFSAYRLDWLSTPMLRQTGTKAVYLTFSTKSFPALLTKWHQLRLTSPGPSQKRISPAKNLSKGSNSSAVYACLLSDLIQWALRFLLFEGLCSVQRPCWPDFLSLAEDRRWESHDAYGKVKLQAAISWPPLTHSGGHLICECGNTLPTTTTWVSHVQSNTLASTFISIFNMLVHVKHCINSFIAWLIASDITCTKSERRRIKVNFFIPCPCSFA